MKLTDTQRAIVKGTLETILTILLHGSEKAIGQETEKTMRDAMLEAFRANGFGPAMGLVQAQQIGDALDSALLDRQAAEQEVRAILLAAEGIALKGLEMGGVALLAAI